MTPLFGILAGLLSALLFGLYMVPRKLSHASVPVFLSHMMVGVLLAVAVFQLFIPGEPWPNRHQFSLTVLAGLIWSVSTFCFTASITRIGLASGTTIKNTTAVWGTLLGLTVFGETADTDPIFAVVGSLLVVGSAAVVAWSANNKGHSASRSTWGLALAAAASIGYSGYSVPIKMVLLTGLSQVRMLVGVTTGAAIGVLTGLLLAPGALAELRGLAFRERRWSFFGGLTWALAMLSLITSVDLVGLAVSWPVSNVNTVVAASIGAVWFKEVDLRKRGGPFWVALALAAAGVVLLGLAKR